MNKKGSRKFFCGKLVIILMEGDYQCCATDHERIIAECVVCIVFAHIPHLTNGKWYYKKIVRYESRFLASVKWRVGLIHFEGYKYNRMSY